MTNSVQSQQNDLEPRLVGLFAQADLLDEAEIRAYQAKSRKYKHLVEVLKQDAFSLGTFRDLLFRAEINPFKLLREGDEWGGQLTAPMALSPAELEHILQTFRPAPERLAKTLEAAGVVEEGAIRAAVAQAKQSKEDPYAWLVRRGVVTPDVINRYLESASNPLPRVCALHLALLILNRNGILGASAFEKTLAVISEKNPEANAAEARKAVKIGSPELLAKIESGLFLQELDLKKEKAGRKLLNLFPESFIRRRTILPVSQDARTLGVVTADPLDLSLSVFIRWVSEKWLQPYFSPSSAIIDCIQELCGGEEVATGELNGESGGGNSVRPASRAAKAQSRAVQPRVETKPEAPAQRAAADAPVDSLSAVKLVSSIIESAIELKATDVHLEPGRGNMTIRFRIDVVLTKMLNIPANLIGPVTSRIKVLANMDVTERRRPQDGHITLHQGGRNFDFRIATLPTANGEKVAVRILDSARVMVGMGDVGMNAAQLKAAERLIHQPYGVILVTGPTGSGKTSTLYAALNELNDEKRHLVTIEDPIEYQLDGINQVEVDPNIGLTFSEGLRAILRQDPNIIMVGEIRDADTAKTAIRAALTGHLVFSTLHTNSAIGAFQALANLGATPYMIGSAVTGVIAQRLVRKLCPACRKAAAPTKAIAAQLGVKSASREKWHRAVGCPACLGTGYSGRTGIFELIEMTEKLRQGVLNDESPAKLRQIAAAEGRLSIREAGLEKVRQGITSPEEVIQKVILEG